MLYLLVRAKKYVLFAERKGLDMIRTIRISDTLMSDYVIYEHIYNIKKIRSDPPAA